MFRATARKLAVAEASLSRNNPRGQSMQVYTREALDKVFFPGYFEVRGQRSLPLAGAPFWGALLPSLSFRKRVPWIAHRCTAVRRMVSTETRQKVTRESEGRGTRRKQFTSFLSSSLRELNFSHQYRLQYFPPVGVTTLLGVWFSGFSNTNARQLRR